MCGIAGSFGDSLLLPATGAAAATRDALAHRGPDHFATWREADVSLLHWRLSIIDLTAAGHQPMTSSDGRWVICYNGEVYNFEELRADVERAWAAAGSTERRWRGRSDTEVILEGFAAWGPDILPRLNGIFALACYDRTSRTLHLARDRAGVKPLYTWERGRTLLFGSEPKVFFRDDRFEAKVDARGLGAFFTYGHCYASNHVLDGVRELEPGEVVSYSNATPSALAVTRKRFCPKPRRRPVERTDAAAAAELRRTLTEAVGRQLVADVPVGVLLSGGVDSSVLAALTARWMGRQTQTFTLGYPGSGPDTDEIEHARRVAKHLGVEHHVYEASQDDLVTDVERLVWHYDEPFADAAALNMFVLSRFIRSRVTVALAGEGADELFGGYRRYQLERAIRRSGPLPRAMSRVIRAAGLERVPGVPRRLEVLLRALARPTAAARYSSYLESEIPASAILRPEWRSHIELNADIAAEYPDERVDDVVGRLCIADQLFWLPGDYLQKSDKGAMAHGLEVRVPYLDNEVVDFANSLPDRQRIRGAQRKWLVREAFADVVPAEVFQRFKRGFGVPVSRWLRRELREYFVDTVLSPGARVRDYLQMPAVEDSFRAHASGARDYSGTLWRCLMLETWLRHLERRFASPLRPAPHLASAPEPRPRAAAPAK